MTHPERVEDYLEHIAEAIERATRYIGNLKNLQALEQDQQAQDCDSASWLDADRRRNLLFRRIRRPKDPVINQRRFIVEPLKQAEVAALTCEL